MIISPKEETSQLRHLWKCERQFFPVIMIVIPLLTNVLHLVCGVRSCSWRATVLGSLNQPIKVYGMRRNFQAGVLEQVGAKLCRTLDPQEQYWTPLHLAFLKFTCSWHTERTRWRLQCPLMQNQSRSELNVMNSKLKRAMLYRWCGWTACKGGWKIL